MKLNERVYSYQQFKKLLEESNKIPQDVVNDLGFSAVLFSDWKSGKSAPEVGKLVKIAEYFDVPINYFLIEE